MSTYYYIVFALVSFLASSVGAICGMGGGVIIKPVLDAFGVMSVASISFLSGCTVLGMSFYSIVKAKTSGEFQVEAKTGTPLAIGGALGGVAGKIMFQNISALFADQNRIGAIQASCLLVITFGTLVYTIKKKNIKTHHVSGMVPSAIIGAVLGVFSSFLGIGGGPINLVALFFFFSMNTKVAAQNSLYIILFSQFASLINSILTDTVPEFSFTVLIVMMVCGILGGMIGRVWNKKVEEDVVDKLFIGMMILIMLINVYNIYSFMGI